MELTQGSNDGTVWFEGVSGELRGGVERRILKYLSQTRAELDAHLKS